jgi:thioredoxin reductase (NADPH)
LISGLSCKTTFNKEKALLYGANLEHGRVTTLQRRPQGGFRAQWNGRDIAARTVLLATGLIDESPKVEGLGSEVYDGAVRFCPICDGFEAMDRRIGVLGSADEAGRKALFLRTYSHHVMLFEKEENSEAMRETLRQAGIRRAGRPVRVECLEDGVRVTVEGGATGRR